MGTDRLRLVVGGASPRRSNPVSSPAGRTTTTSAASSRTSTATRASSDDFDRPARHDGFALDPIGAEIGTCALWNSFDYQPAIALTKANTPTSVRGDLDPGRGDVDYVATNPGNTPLERRLRGRRQVRPGHPVPPIGFNAGDTNQNGRLEPGEAWQFTCVREAVSVRGAPPASPSSTRQWSGHRSGRDVVTATASANATAFVPGITVTKLVNGQPGDRSLADLT